MSNDDFSDAALVLVGHGSTLNAESAAPVYQHAKELRRRGIFAQVRECFWKIEPNIPDVLHGIQTPRVFVVPLFISEGYFTGQVIPRELGLCADGQSSFSRTHNRDGQLLLYCGPVGTHESMTEVILGRAREVIEKFPFPRPPKPRDTTLFIAGHGTEKNENSRKSIDRQVELVRAKGIYAAAYPVFLEEYPRVGDCYAMSTTRNLVIVPFFISDGLHSNEDIPEMLGEPRRVVQERLQNSQPTWRNPTEKHGKLVWYSRSIGTEPLLAELILERVREMAGG